MSSSEDGGNGLTMGMIGCLPDTVQQVRLYIINMINYILGTTLLIGLYHLEMIFSPICLFTHTESIDSTSVDNQIIILKIHYIL